MLAACETGLYHEYDLAMFDLDGVVYRGAHAVEYAVPSIDQLAGTMDCAFITNNASRTPDAIADQLQSLGLTHLTSADIVTSAEAVASQIAEHIGTGSSVLTVGGEGLHAAVTAQGLHPVGSAADKPQAVVQGFDRTVDWPQLAEVAYAVAAGVPWYASNTDMSFPTARGLAPGNGSLVHAVAMATGAQPQIAGKPYRGLFDETLQRYRPAGAAIMVGDRLDTDIRGANGAGISSLAVTTGVSDLNTLAAARDDDRPSFVGPDLRSILQPHPKVTGDSTTTYCGLARADRHGTTVVARGGDLLERYRCAIDLAWRISDQHGIAPTIDGTLET